MTGSRRTSHTNRQSGRQVARIVCDAYRSSVSQEAAPPWLGPHPDASGLRQGGGVASPVPASGRAPTGPVPWPVARGPWAGGSGYAISEIRLRRAGHA